MAYSKRYHQIDPLYNQQQQLEVGPASGCIPCVPSHIMHCISSGIVLLGSVTRMCFSEFNNTMKEILPKLSPEQRDQIRKAFSDYHLLLRTSQIFLTRTTLRVRHARIQEDIVKAVDINTLKSLCETISNLLDKFQGLTSIVEEKIRDEKVVENYRNITGRMFMIAAGILMIGSGVGAAFGLSMTLNGVLAISGAIMITGVVVNGITQVAQQLSAFNEVICNLNKLKSNLSQLSQTYSKIDGMGDDLTMDDKNEFLGILKQAQNEVDQGFKILATF